MNWSKLSFYPVKWIELGNVTGERLTAEKKDQVLYAAIDDAGCLHIGITQDGLVIERFSYRGNYYLEWKNA